MKTADDVVVIVKAAGERTVGASLALLREQVPADRILVVDERESVSAIRRTYELGIDRSASWTMTLGGDALLRRGAVEEFVAEAARMPAHYFQIEARSFDKFTGLYRQAGQRVYRTALLTAALAHVPLPGATMSSEYSVLQAMGRAGHPSRRVSLVVGLHDFEQYYRDVYVSAVVHALKSPQLVPLIVRRCLAYWESDPDFKVVLKGLYEGITRGRDALDDARRSDAALSDDSLAQLGLAEKSVIDPLGYDVLSFWRTYQTILLANVPPRFDTSDEPTPVKSAVRARWDIYADRIWRRGWPRATAGAIGGLLRRTGEWLEAREIGGERGDPAHGPLAGIDS